MADAPLTIHLVCPATGGPHHTFWMRSALWCHDCKMKLETCCEGPCS